MCYSNVFHIKLLILLSCILSLCALRKTNVNIIVFIFTILLGFYNVKMQIIIAMRNKRHSKFTSVAFSAVTTQ